MREIVQYCFALPKQCEPLDSINTRRKHEYAECIYPAERRRAHHDLATSAPQLNESFFRALEGLALATPGDNPPRSNRILLFKRTC